MLELKSTVKEIVLRDDHDIHEVKVTATYDSEFRTWSAYVNLAVFDQKTDEDAVIALEEPAKHLIRAIQGCSTINGSTKRLVVREAITLEDAEKMRCIRNACRQYMTRNQEYISFVQQQEWWSSIDRDKLIPLLAFDSVDTNIAIGYGLSRLGEDGRKWVTGALLPEFRGKGLGELLFKEIIRFAGIPCWLEVLTSNTPARALYEKLGFNSTSEMESCTQTMTLRKPL